MSGLILHVVPGAPFGGAQRLAIDLAQAQRAGGMDARLLALGHSPEVARAAEAAGVPSKDCGSGLSRPINARNSMAPAHIVHLHMPPFWLVPFVPAGPAVVLHLHVQPGAQVVLPSVRLKLDSWGEAQVLRRTGHAIAISRWIADAWEREYPALMPSVSVVHNGTALAPISPRPAGPFTVGAAGRLSRVKGSDEFVALAAAIHARDPQIHFRMAGDGPDRKVLEARVADLGLTQVFTFEGFVDDMPGFWSRVHLSAFTPPFEPFGLRLIEPMAHGVPVIGYRTGSGSDEVIDLNRGVAAVPYPDADALADLAVALARDPVRLARMATEGREDLEQHFSLASMEQGVRAAYGHLLGGTVVAA